MNIRPKKLLWPTDFSELSMKAAPYARRYREVFGAELHVVNVFMMPVGVGLSLAEDSILESSRERLQRVVAEQFSGDSSVICEAMTGNPWSGVCGYAERVGIDLIILATHGLTGLRRLFIGSTAERVVQHAPCPVLTIRSVEHDFTIK